MTTAKAKPIAAVTLSVRDWVHVINAVESSYRRKAKRGDRRGADEMELIGSAMIEQVQMKNLIKETRK